MDFTEESLTGSAGLAFLAAAARRCGLFGHFRGFAPCKVRRRGASDSENLWSLVSLLARGSGTLSDVDSLKGDGATRTVLGLSSMSGSRRLGEWLLRMTDAHVASLRGISHRVAATTAPAVIDHELSTRGYVPVFIDGTAIEVDGDHFEGASVNYGEKRQYWMHAAFVGRLQVSARLEPGNRDSVGDWQAQLERDVKPLVDADTPVWVLMDNAYYRGELVSRLRQWGWDWSMSVTNRNNKAPILRLAEEADHWQALDDDGVELACRVRYRPSGWSETQHYVVVQRWSGGPQPQMFPVSTSVILTSRDDLPLSEVVRRHRSKQGFENGFKGPLIEMDLHHPPSRGLGANRVYYLCGLIAQQLLCFVQYRLIGGDACDVGLRPLIRDVIRSVARVTRSGRRWQLRFSRTNGRLGWFYDAIRRIDEVAFSGPG